MPGAGVSEVRLGSEKEKVDAHKKDRILSCVSSELVAYFLRMR